MQHLVIYQNMEDKIYQMTIFIIMEIEKEKNSFLMTPEFKKDILEIARYMAKMKDKELKNYVYDKVKAERKMQKER